MKIENNNFRLKEIDFLRGLAILLVLLFHHPLFFHSIRMGWAGVDLFFVLSGFLVSGLYFSEYKKTGDVKIGLFLIRRGFKIYPLFYVVMLITIIYKFILLKSVSINQVLAELFFVQNYFEGIWNHTWSLAIEEHFYFGLSFIVLILARVKQITNNKLIMSLMILIGLVSLVLRVQNYFSGESTSNFLPHPTHLRLDGLFLGVYLAHLYHFNYKQLAGLIIAYKWSVLFISIVLLSASWFWLGDTPFCLTLLYLGFAGLLLTFLFNAKFVGFLNAGFNKYFYKFMCLLGFYSYSLYLTHVIFVGKFMLLLNPYIDSYGFGINFIVYFSASITVAILSAKAIELPMLKVRDIYFPKIKKN